PGPETSSALRTLDCRPTSERTVVICKAGCQGPLDVAGGQPHCLAPARAPCGPPGGGSGDARGRSARIRGQDGGPGVILVRLGENGYAPQPEVRSCFAPI